MSFILAIGVMVGLIAGSLVLSERLGWTGWNKFAAILAAFLVALWIGWLLIRVSIPSDERLPVTDPASGAVGLTVTTVVLVLVLGAAVALDRKRSGVRIASLVASLVLAGLWLWFGPSLVVALLG